MIGNGFENIFGINEESVEATAMEEKFEVPKEVAPEALLIALKTWLMFSFILWK